MKKIFILILSLILIISCEGENDKTNEVSKVRKEEQKFEKLEENKTQDNEPRVTKNKENGDYVLQIIVPENATEKEISDVLMNTAVANKKRFQGDNIMVVAYSDEYYMYKSLLGTHGQMRLINGGTDFIKISPKENITENDKKDFKEYFELYQAIKDTGSSETETRKELKGLLKARHGDRYKEIIEKSEKYFFDINKLQK